MKALRTVSMLGILLIVTAFVSQESMSKPLHKRHRMPFSELELFSDELGLTEEQQTKIKEQRFQTDKEAIELRSKIKIAELELRELLHSEDPDEGQIKNKIEEIGSLKTQLRFTLVKSQLEIRNTLTPEQLEKLKLLKKERIKKRIDGRLQFREGRPRRPSLEEDESFEFRGNFKPDFDEFEDGLMEI
jgi:Spy/CpxP family protein refolding chaperone